MKKWIVAGKTPWVLVGNETQEDKKILTEALDKTAEWMCAWVQGLEPYWLVLVGASGTGKTFLAERAADYAREWGASVYRRTVADKLGDGDDRRIYGYVQTRGPLAKWRDIVPTDDDRRIKLTDASKDWFKIIDDLKPQTGQESVIDGETGIQPKKFEVTAAGDLLDERLRKWTIITSNLTRSQLAIFWDARIASRLMRHESVLVDLSTVEDFGLRRERQHRESRR